MLIIAGALDGARGFLLSILMSKAMNRSFTNVLFGAFGGGDGNRAAQRPQAMATREAFRSKTPPCSWPMPAT